MLKITKTLESERDVQLLLEGKIAGEWAALLDGVCNSYLLEEVDVQLDCAHVDFVDARGVAVLNGLPRQHVSVINAPGFITQLLSIGDQS